MRSKRNLFFFGCRRGKRRILFVECGKHEEHQGVQHKAVADDVRAVVKEHNGDLGKICGKADADVVYDTGKHLNAHRNERDEECRLLYGALKREESIKGEGFDEGLVALLRELQCRRDADLLLLSHHRNYLVRDIDDDSALQSLKNDVCENAEEIKGDLILHRNAVDKLGHHEIADVAVKNRSAVDQKNAAHAAKREAVDRIQDHGVRNGEDRDICNREQKI